MSAAIPVIGIVDPSCNVCYAPGAMPERGLGGTEATVARIVAALQGDFAFHLYQKPCHARAHLRAATLRPLADAERGGPARALIVINSWKLACRLRRFHPQIPISLWLHVYPGRHNRGMGRALAEADIDVICVSRTHAEALGRFLKDGPRPRISHIYNPISDDLRPDATARDKQRLLFASSPHKGLAEVFAHFRNLRQHLPDLILNVADPGYLAWDTGPVPEGVRFLGHLDHPDLIHQMRQALCLFFPQASFAETFGLVIAEANAVGTPVLAQKGLGGNDEVIGGPGQLIDTADPAAILARIKAWRRAPGGAHTHAAFRLTQVETKWRERLGQMVGEPQHQSVRPAE